MPDDCPFCVVDASRLAFRNEQVLAIWDRYPVSNGHLLIVTERHIADWFEASDAERLAILSALDQGRRIVQQRYAADGFNIGVNVGSAAGQTIPHLHVHLIPRFQGDVPDPRGGVRHLIPGRGNYLKLPTAGFDLLRESDAQSLLVRGIDDPLLQPLRRCLDQAVSADFAVAFILKSGVDKIREHLRDLLARGGHVRILTGDYLNSTDPDALMELLDLGDNLQLRVYEVADSSFHPKAYIFHSRDGEGTAFVGSSNLSSTALGNGVEWNYRIVRANEDRGFAEVVSAFEQLFVHPQTRVVDPDWLDAYRTRRGIVSPTCVVEVPVEPPTKPPDPHVIQREALAALQATRQAGNEAGLVVLATGLGKTWLAAFDSASEEFRRVLFVAHREEILNQALDTFRRIRPCARLGLYSGKKKFPDADVLFASIQTLSRTQHLGQFAPESFDYIIVDEFHHASARTYRRLIEYFTPQFLLGLTATPERTDGGDLLALCQENLVFRRDMVAGIEAGLLCPFQYFGIPDDVDYSNIPWRSNRFDEEHLTTAVATTRRAENALQQYRSRGGQRTLGFCCSRRHADFMADYFNRAGVPSVAVHSGENSAPRASALESLESGKLAVVFAVDMFNEGLDVPLIDTVLMLRPTESSTIWQQQFGRGLRTANGKSQLTVIDYIGNHRSFLIKVRTLLQPLMGRLESDAEISNAIRLYEQDGAELPAGCHITYELEAIDIIKSLLRTRASDDAIVAFYDDFRQRHGVRPMAVELYHSGYMPRSLRKTHGSWAKFVRSMGDLNAQEKQAVDSAGDFLEFLETTPMTKSFKMLTLLAMLNRNAITGQIDIGSLTSEFRRVARRNETLRADVGSCLDDDRQLRVLIEKNPIAAWCAGKGTGGRAYFRYDGTTLATDFTLPDGCRDEFQELVRELVEWRLAEYLDRGHLSQGTGRFVCKVIHAGGRPILKLPDRNKTTDVPSDWVDILVDGQPRVASFVKQFVNVIRADRDATHNVLADIVRDWFGPDAGRPGTGYQVAFERQGDRWRMEPVTPDPVAPVAVTWQHYKREDIPPLFQLTFNPAVWNQGFVASDGHLFLLVTLEKGGLNKDHRYEDRFLSDQSFHWQSQNKTKQDSKHGQIMQNHRDRGVKVHLFVRKHKVLNGKSAPFVYCGLVDFETWAGEQPISVQWRLHESVPEGMRRALDVPETPE